MNFRLKNYLKISVVLFIGVISSNVFADEIICPNVGEHGEATIANWVYGQKCCVEEFQDKKEGETDNNALDSRVKDFFGYSTDSDETKVSFVDGIFSFASAGQGTMNIDSSTDQNPQQTKLNSQLTVCDGCTLYMKPKSTLALGPGGIVNINGDAKLFVAGDIFTDPNSVINVGNKDSGGWFILNATKTESDDEYMIVPDMTIKLLNKDSHVDVHGNEMYFPKIKIYRYHPDATVHFYNETFKNKKFNPFAEDTDKYFISHSTETAVVTPHG